MFKRVLLLLIVIVTGCSNSEPVSRLPIELSGVAMTMHYRVMIGQELTEQDLRKIDHLLTSTFGEVHNTYDIWNPDSELSRLNHAPANKWIPLSPELEKLLLLTGNLVTLTQGYFDPTITSAYNLWKEKLTSGSLPSREEINKLKEFVGWDKVQISEGKFLKSHDDVQIDLGGIAKGYCVDLITERLIADGFENCYVEWGGEIRTSGKHPDDRPWNIYISNLADIDPDNALAIVALTDEALATSGDYLQQWVYPEEERDMIYTHIIDPMALTPLVVNDENICSATVKARTCAEADALATAAMIYPSTAEANRWSREVREHLPEAQFWFVTRKELAK